MANHPPPLPFTTIKDGLKVAVARKVHNELSGVRPEHIGKVFTIRGIDYGGRTHNKYISCLYLHSTKFGQINAVIDEITLLNPNCEPDGEFIVCVGCGATIAESELKVFQYMRNIKACPSCAMLEPNES